MGLQVQSVWEACCCDKEFANECSCSLGWSTSSSPFNNPSQACIPLHLRVLWYEGKKQYLWETLENVDTLECKPDNVAHFTICSFTRNLWGILIGLPFQGMSEGDVLCSCSWVVQLFIAGPVEIDDWLHEERRVSCHDKGNKDNVVLTSRQLRHMG